jgi:pyridoxal phosphate-dependent aminotransferase EpsN
MSQIIVDRQQEKFSSDIQKLVANSIAAAPLNSNDIEEFIYLSSPHMGGHEMKYIEEAFRTNWIAPLGPLVESFEEKMAQFLGAKKAVALSSGTAAIHLALVVLGVTQGDLVFCSDFTFVATANPIKYLGATPVFIDSEPTSWNMSPVALERAFQEVIKQKMNLPKAVIVVDLYGHVADFDSIREVCSRYNVPIIEDAAESLGATYKGRMSGSLGDLSILSFNGNKIITTSGGGMLLSNNENLTQHARFLSTQARKPSIYYEHDEVGYNYRMSSILAGIGLGQMHVLEERVKARVAVFHRYREALSDIECISWMPDAPHESSNRWLTILLLDLSKTSVTPEKIIETLKADNIESRPVWKPMHLQSIFKDCLYFTHSPEESVSEKFFQCGICLPSGSNLTVAQQGKVINSIRKCLI